MFYFFCDNLIGHMKNIIKLMYRYMVLGAGYRVSLGIRAISFFRERNPYFARFIAIRMQIKYGVFISPKAVFDASLSLRHPVAIIIGDGVKLGKNVVLYQNVTLGGSRLGDGAAGNYPEVGDNTVIFSGAAVIGSVKIGNNCVIGANSVVLKDIPDNCTAAGVPAKIIKRRDYEY